MIFFMSTKKWRELLVSITAPLLLYCCHDLYCIVRRICSAGHLWGSKPLAPFVNISYYWSREQRNKTIGHCSQPVSPEAPHLYKVSWADVSCLSIKLNVYLFKLFLEKYKALLAIVLIFALR